MNFWQSISKPIFALAPMEDVTDTVFREIIISISDPDIIKLYFAEFISTDGLCHVVGKDRVSHRLRINDSEKILLKQSNAKIIAQIWGSDPNNFYKATQIISNEYEFDGIDINMGCPVKKIVKQGGCSALIGKPQLATEIIQATKEATNLPVSVKTRTGLSSHNTEDWIATLLDAKPSAITLHGRTQKMMSEYPADWNEIGKAVQIRNSIDSEIPIIGNGDVWTYEDAINKIKQTDADGVMIGRGIFRNPWIFSKNQQDRTPEEKLELLWEHTNLFVETWGAEKNFSILKRFFKIYTYNFEHAAEIRGELMNCKDIDEVAKVLRNCAYKLKI